MRNKINILNKYFNLFDKIPRHFFVLGIFVIIFIIIIKTTYNYTINDHKFYQKKADIQQI
jgi:cell division protein FtsI/penicillin-binding protein 2